MSRWCCSDRSLHKDSPCWATLSNREIHIYYFSYIIQFKWSNTCAYLSRARIVYINNGTQGSWHIVEIVTTVFYYNKSHSALDQQAPAWYQSIESLSHHLLEFTNSFRLTTAYKHITTSTLVFNTPSWGTRKTKLLLKEASLWMVEMHDSVCPAWKRVQLHIQDRQYLLVGSLQVDLNVCGVDEHRFILSCALHCPREVKEIPFLYNTLIVFLFSTSNVPCTSTPQSEEETVWCSGLKDWYLNGICTVSLGCMKNPCWPLSGPSVIRLSSTAVET